MKTRIVFIERIFWKFVSIEKVFRQIAESLSVEKFQTDFQKLRFGNRLTGILKNLIFYKPPVADIFHITGHIHYMAFRLPAARTVLTIHDLGLLKVNRGIKRYVLKKIYLDFPVRKLKYITTISEATKAEIVRYTGCDENKIRVIENPLFTEFKISGKKECNKQCPVILQIGTGQHKNLPNLIEAVKDLNCKLDIVGHLNDAQKELLRANKILYENSFELTDEELLEKYKNADIVSFCSTFEGFGLPIIEAQAMLTPVITSNISPLKEVAGSGAVLVDPRETDQIREAILKIMKDDDFREKLITEGKANSERFEPGKIALQYENLYREIVENLKIP